MFRVRWDGIIVMEGPTRDRLQPEESWEQTIMLILLCCLIAAVVFVLAASMLWHAKDKAHERKAWARLVEPGRTEGAVYDPALVADLPEPAQRYFNYAIRTGASLRSVFEIDMTGELGLGTPRAPGYQPMQAFQTLAPPYGLVWKLKAGFLSGSVGALPNASWTRFWLLGVVPVVRDGGPDHLRSAFGRVVAEAAFWAPASLLPGPYVHWEPIDDNSARAVFAYRDFIQAVALTVNVAGAPIEVIIQRWSNANSENIYQEQPFGGFLSGFREFDGYRLPTRVEGGNHFGTPHYFPFFKARVTAIRFPGSETG